MQQPIFQGAIVFTLASLAAAQTTTRLSLDSSGVQGNAPSRAPSISDDGRFVAFGSAAFNLDPADANGYPDIFVRDLAAGTTTIASLAWNGAAGDRESVNPSISADGRFVLFVSWAANLVPNDTNVCADLFLRDRVAGTLERISVSSGGVEGNWDSWHQATVTPDGRFVAFDSHSWNLVANDTNGHWDVFVRDRLLGTTERVSLSGGSAQGNDDSVLGRISPDGRYVAFLSLAANLVSGDTNGKWDVFVRDRLLGTTERVSVSNSGAQSNGNVGSFAITPDFRWLAFDSDATNLVAGGISGWGDVYVRDRLAGTTQNVSVTSFGQPGNGGSIAPAISADGRCVTFLSVATNLVAGDANGMQDVFVHDRAAGSTVRASVSSSSVQSDDESAACSISGDGRLVAFDSLATNLVAGDTNSGRDVFLRDRGTQAPGSDLCLPGSAGVLACPCGNPSTNSPGGCDNSAATGGAQLLASGTASIAADTLAFDTQGETNGAFSVLLQGSAELPAGVVFGQGVRCVGGTLLRMYASSAPGGALHVPAAGDASVSARAAALGSPIAGLALRWYQIYYRDNVVLGGCPAASSFNATQALRVLWLP